MITIELTKNQKAIIDDIDIDLSNLNWHARYDKTTQKFYVGRADKNRKTVLLHRVILSRILKRPLEKSEQADHIDLNPLNNCRNNLRLANNSENQTNKEKYKNSISSKYKGVDYYHKYSKWRSRITKNGKSYHLGYYDTEEEAAHKYNEYATLLHNKFSRLNSI